MSNPALQIIGSWAPVLQRQSYNEQVRTPLSRATLVVGIKKISALPHVPWLKYSGWNTLATSNLGNMKLKYPGLNTLATSSSALKRQFYTR